MCVVWREKIEEAIYVYFSFLCLARTLNIDGDVHHPLDAGRILLPLAKFAVFNALKTKMTSSSDR